MMKPSSVGQYSVIGKNVTFGENVIIGHHVVIYDGVKIGHNVIIQDHAVIGKQPTRAKSSVLPERKQFTPTTIGSGCTIGTSAIIYAAASLEIGRASCRERV